MRKTILPIAILASFALVAGCVARHPTGYDIGSWGVNFSHGESRDFISSYSFGVSRADPATFVALTNGTPWFGKDKAHAYFEQYEIKGADPATFRVISTDVLSGAFSADKDSVFFEQMKLEGANPATIDLSRAPFVTDGQHVYDGYAILPGAVWPVANIRGVGMVKDASGAFFARKSRRGSGDTAVAVIETYYVPFAPCDPATFPMTDARRIVQSMDARCAYYETEKIPLTDRASFAFLDWGWSRDNGGVFYRAERVDGADPATAEVVRSSSARTNPDDYFDGMHGAEFLRDRHGCRRDAQRAVEPCPADAAPIRSS